jgi:hypothetical protein
VVRRRKPPLAHWNPYRKNRTFAGVAFHFGFSFVKQGDVPDDTQPEAGTALLLAP